jgi:hypothetical protein
MSVYEMEGELTAALATIEKCREVSGCPAGVDLQDHLRQLAAENVAAKKIISECREYFIAGVMNRIRPTNEGYLHMICDTFADETPATDRIVAGIKADGVEEFAAMTEKVGDEEGFYDNGESSEILKYTAKQARLFAKQLREGAK